MKKIITALACVIFVLTLSMNATAQECTTIQDGTLETTDGEPLATGFSVWGYNYQAHIFNGMYCDYHPLYRPGGPYYDWCQTNYGDTDLIMKWNEAWLSNKSCDTDPLLDRHYGYSNYQGSGAWLTNHMRGSYVDNGKTCKWNYFVKIVAVPDGAYKTGGIWYTATGIEIGRDIWGIFAIIEEVSNDKCAGEHGVQYISPAGPGFGQY